MIRLEFQSNQMFAGFIAAAFRAISGKHRGKIVSALDSGLTIKD